MRIKNYSLQELEKPCGENSRGEEALGQAKKLETTLGTCIYISEKPLGEAD